MLLFTCQGWAILLISYLLACCFLDTENWIDATLKMLLLIGNFLTQSLATREQEIKKHKDLKVLGRGQDIHMLYLQYSVVQLPETLGPAF